MTGGTRIAIADAVALLRRGGVLAYPTEGVWGLGCDPFDEGAVMRLLGLKQRAVDKGLILVGATAAQFDGLADWDALPGGRLTDVLSSWPGPSTWIIPATPRLPHWITGAHDSVALRVSAHREVSALCEAFGGPLVSTSANRAGAPAPRRFADLEPALLGAVDGCLAGETGDRDRPSDIRDARSGALLR